MLSSGEKTVVMKSFITALWECMESPLRILDDFDTSMDHITRRLYINGMIDLLLRSDCQYICFTNQELPLTPIVTLAKIVVL